MLADIRKINERRVKLREKVVNQYVAIMNKYENSKQYKKRKQELEKEQREQLNEDEE